MAQESAAYWRVRDKGRHLWATWGRQGSAAQPLDPIDALLAAPEPDLDPPMSDDAGSLKYN